LIMSPRAAAFLRAGGAPRHWSMMRPINPRKQPAPRTLRARVAHACRSIGCRV
jgi:hypothetical protein